VLDRRTLADMRALSPGKELALMYDHLGALSPEATISREFGGNTVEYGGIR
jgi:hypothetical protein